MGLQFLDKAGIEILWEQIQAKFVELQNKIDKKEATSTVTAIDNRLKEVEADLKVTTNGSNLGSTWIDKTTYVLNDDPTLSKYSTYNAYTFNAGSVYSKWANIKQSIDGKVFSSKTNAGSNTSAYYFDNSITDSSKVTSSNKIVANTAHISSLDTKLTSFTSTTYTQEEMDDNFAKKNDLTSVFKFISVVTAQGELNNLISNLANKKVGEVYHVTFRFETTAAFIEGAGNAYPQGTNIVVVKEGTANKLDVLAGAFAFEAMGEGDIKRALGLTTS